MVMPSSRYPSFLHSSSCRLAVPCTIFWTRQGAEGPNDSSGFSYLALKRRSSLSELTEFFQDLVNDGESRNIANLPIPESDLSEDKTKDAKAAACSTQQATEQVKEGGERKEVQRASIYLLMHAMAAVDAANDEADAEGVKNHARL